MTEPLTAPGKTAAPPEQQESFSVSKLKMYLRCPASYYFRHVLGLRPPSTSHQMLGSSIHSAIEHNFRSKKVTRKDLPLAVVQEFYSANFDYMKGQVLWEDGEDAGKFKDIGAQMIELYHTQAAPQIMPELTEEPFQIKFENCNYVFKGIIDLVTDEGLLVDHKTSSRTPSAEAIHKDLQGTAYALGVRYLTKKVETGIAFDYIIRAKVPKIIRIPSSRTQDDIDRFLQLLGHIMMSVQVGLFYPNNTGQFCTSKNCSYWGECEGGRKFNYAAPTK